MSEMEDQLGAILGNPQMMEKIMSLAQSLGQSEAPPQGKPEPGGKPEAPGRPEPPPQPSGDMDLAMVKALTGFARNSSIDKDQKTLLNALCPYISKEKRQKLERAMRAAKMAQQASCLFEAGGKKGL